MSHRAVTIVVPTWNGRHLLEEFLPSVLQSVRRYAVTTGAEAEVLVVDDGSTDDTASWLSERMTAADVPLRLVRQPSNTGFGPACNRGMQDARFDLVLLLNNDLEIAADAIAPLVAHFDDAPALFAVHCRAVDARSGRESGAAQAADFSRGFLRVHGRYVPDADAPPPIPSLFASGGCAMFRRRLFLGIGGFDPIFAPYYYEDVELSYRAWKRGFEVRYEPASAVRHRFSSTIAALPRPRVRRISQRNRLLFHWIHLHDAGWLAQHLAWLPGVAIASLLSLRPHFALGLADAIRRLDQVRSRRAGERAAARRSDRQVVAAAQGQKKRPA